MGILAGTLASLGSVLVLSLLRLDHSQYITPAAEVGHHSHQHGCQQGAGRHRSPDQRHRHPHRHLGALMAETVCKVCHITHPIARGIGIGTAAHAVGTSKALQMGEVEGAMSGLAVAVAGVMTAILCPVFSSFIS